MKKLIVAIVLVFTIGLIATSCEKEKKEVKKELTTQVYQCPMDCEKGKSYTKSGSCPVCKMALKVKTAGEAKKVEDHSGHGHSH